MSNMLLRVGKFLIHKALQQREVLKRSFHHTSVYSFYSSDPIKRLKTQPHPAVDFNILNPQCTFSKEIRENALSLSGSSGINYR